MIVSVENLSHSYGERLALDKLSFSVPEGQIFGLLGPNGGGKSTLFKILSTILFPSSGRVSIAGLDVVQQPDQVRRRIGVVFQTNSLDKKLSVSENLHAQGHLYGLTGKLRHQRVDEAMLRLGLTHRRDDIVGTLSGGLQRRVEIAKAVLHHPQLLLMDEASTGLDPKARLEMWQYIAEFRTELRVTVLLTSHILEEADRCDRLLLLHQGRQVAEGSPAELKARVGGDVVELGVTDLKQAQSLITSTFGVEAQILDGFLRVQVRDGHRWIGDLVEALPGRVQSVALHKPTLEDVFLNETGVRLD